MVSCWGTIYHMRNYIISVFLGFYKFLSHCLQLNIINHQIEIQPQPTHVLLVFILLYNRTVDNMQLCPELYVCCGVDNWFWSRAVRFMWLEDVWSFQICILVLSKISISDSLADKSSHAVSLFQIESSSSNHGAYAILKNIHLTISSLEPVTCGETNYVNIFSDWQL